MHNPHIEELSDGRSKRLIADYVYQYNGYTFFVPQGFEYDGCSIPRLPGLWLLIGTPNTTKARVPCLIHDWLCITGKVSWKKAAQLFKELMIVTGVPTWRRVIIYWAVRLYEPFHTPNLYERQLCLAMQRDRLHETQQIFDGEVL